MTFDHHAVLAAHGVTAAHVAAAESMAASGRLSFGQIISLLLKYGPVALAVLSQVSGVLASGGTFDLATLLGILQSLQGTSAGKEIITAILGLLKITVPAGF